MGLSTAGADIGLDAVAESATHVSLHTDDPSTTGANEVTGGSPAYARKAATWSTASGGSISLAAAVTFDVPASTTVKYYAAWDAATSGNFLGSGALSADEEFAAQGTYKLGTGSTISIS